MLPVRFKLDTYAALGIPPKLTTGSALGLGSPPSLIFYASIIYHIYKYENTTFEPLYP